jgi:hypothetical protein
MLIALDSGIGQTMAIIGLRFPRRWWAGSRQSAGVEPALIAPARVLLIHRRPAAVGGGAVPGPDRHAGGAAVGLGTREGSPVSDGAASCFASAPAMRGTSG